MKKAYPKLFNQLKGYKLQCLNCQRQCLIKDGQVGFCQTRLNQKGQLFSLTYGILNGLQIDPIEKKPMYHFYPGTQVLSLGSYGCNYRCKQCLNSHCSWGEPAAKMLQELKVKSEKLKVATRNANAEMNFISPQQIIRLALQKNIPGIAFTYNEPTLWSEYVYDTAKLAKKAGLYTVMVTNGSWTEQTLKYLAPVIDACNIDIKGFYSQSYQKQGAFFGQILKTTTRVVKKYQIFTELTTLIIPTINDSQKELKAIASWIKKDLGAEIPWHLSRFDPNLAPDKDFQKLPDTSIKTLKMAYKIGKKAGLKHIYVWAPPKNISEELFSIGDTRCPHCDKVVVQRSVWQSEIFDLQGNNCKFCGQKINLMIK